MTAWQQNSGKKHQNELFQNSKSSSKVCDNLEIVCQRKLVTTQEEQWALWHFHLSFSFALLWSTVTSNTNSSAIKNTTAWREESAAPPKSSALLENCQFSDLSGTSSFPDTDNWCFLFFSPDQIDPLKESLLIFFYNSCWFLFHWFPLRSLLFPLLCLFCCCLSSFSSIPQILICCFHFHSGHYVFWFLLWFLLWSIGYSEVYYFVSKYLGDFPNRFPLYLL